MKQLKKIKGLLNLLFLFLILFCLNACRMKAEQKSLTYRLEIIDSLIAQNQKKQAFKELKKVQKKAVDSWSYLGVYKRYLKLAENDAAEKLIKKAVKRHSNNPEILAVYSKYLINGGRFEEAEKLAEKLKNTKYGSVYSEVYLRKALKNKSSDDSFAYFVQEPFFQIFFDAYNGSKNPLWLKNCAVYMLYTGELKKAATLNPAFYADADDAYFWATVLYDGGEFYDSINALEKSKQFLKDYQNSGLYRVSQIAQIALESDSFMALSDFQGAENVRQEIVPVIFDLPKKEGDDSLIPVIMVNSALWAKGLKDADATADLLFDIVTNYPDFVPGLILYADFAYETSLEREEDDEVKALRRAGISSLAMEKYDNRRKIPLSDALYRIDLCLEKGPEPYLEMEKLDLEYKANRHITEKEKTRDLWTILERNYIEGEKYKELLVQYAVNFLLRTKQTEDAYNLFYKYIYDKYHFNDKEAFFVQFAERVKEINLPMAEFGGYFSCLTKNFSEALRIYEFCVYESGGITSDGQISTRVGTAACMNLSDMYFANGEKQRAMDLYGKTAGREVNNKLRSDIFFRLANIYVSEGDNKNALRSADYAYNIDNENERAFLLRTKLRSMN